MDSVIFQVFLNNCFGDCEFEFRKVNGFRKMDRFEKLLNLSLIVELINKMEAVVKMQRWSISPKEYSVQVIKLTKEGIW